MCICVCACPNAALPRCLLVVLSNISIASSTCRQKHTQKRGMRHSKPLPSMRLYCEALEKQRGAADGGPSGEGYRERERRTERKRIWWRREKGAEIKEEKVMAMKRLSFSKQLSLFLCVIRSQLVWLQDPDVTLDIKWQIKRLPKLSLVQK